MDNKVLIKYIPHGLDHKKFYPIPKDDKNLEEFKNKLIGDKEKDFILLFNSRNIRRKSIPDTILAWKYFLDKLPKEQKSKCLFILHTQPVEQNGTNLLEVIEYLFSKEDQQTLLISDSKISTTQMNYLFNLSDATILLSSNEGWGLSLTESLLTGTPFIANVTGGMQDQMGFEDFNGEWFTPTEDVPSNHTAHFTKHGKWCKPVFPSNRSLVGSVPTPYIWDDRCRPEDAAQQIRELYNTPPQERQKMGEVGRNWAIDQKVGFTSKDMANRVMKGMDELFKTWEPKQNYIFLDSENYPSRKLNHKLRY
jgi:glycosyltransferase involved in cell wall biosynthesis